MIHTYSITGMTCDGCRSKVEKALNTIDGIEAKVSLSPPVAIITMDKHIPTSKLQETRKLKLQISLWKEMSILVAAAEKLLRELVIK